LFIQALSESLRSIILLCVVCAHIAFKRFVPQQLSPKYYGPFTIAEKLSDVTFRVEWPERVQKIHPVFHASKLVPYNDPQFKGQKYTMPPPEAINNKLHYKVTRVLKSRRTGRGKKLQYYVRWKGYGPNDDT